MPTEDTWRPPNTWCDHTQHWHADDDQATEDEVTELIAALVRALQPEVAVETGTWTGNTTRVIGEALRRNGHGHLHAVESNPEMAALARAKCEGLPVTVHHASSLDWTPPKGIGFAFIDGASDRVAEMNRLQDDMLPGATIAIHDTSPLHVGGRLTELLLQSWIYVITLRTPRGITLAEVK